MPSHKDIALKIGTYTASDGATKNRYKTIGRLVQKDDGGEFIMLDADILHAGLFALANRERADRIACSLFEPRDAKAASAPQAGAFDDLKEDIPF